MFLFPAAMIKGNHSNCAQFADSLRLDWLFNRLESQQASEGKPHFLRFLGLNHHVTLDVQETIAMIQSYVTTGTVYIFFYIFMSIYMNL